VIFAPTVFSDGGGHQRPRSQSSISLLLLLVSPPYARLDTLLLLEVIRSFLRYLTQERWSKSGTHTWEFPPSCSPAFPPLSQSILRLVTVPVAHVLFLPGPQGFFFGETLPSTLSGISIVPKVFLFSRPPSKTYAFSASIHLVRYPFFSSGLRMSNLRVVMPFLLLSPSP